MRKRVVTLFMAFFALMMLGESVASAGAYFGQFSVLKDGTVRAYIDDVVTRDRDGWCANNGIARSWDCFVNKKPSGSNPQIIAAREGEERMLSGRKHRAQLVQPYAGWKPYCAPSLTYYGTGAIKNYACAYWVPV